MSSIVSLPGSAALSTFRLDKIRQEAARIGVALGELSARYWHFLEIDGELDAAAMRLLDQALDYGTPTDAPGGRCGAAAGDAASGHDFAVVVQSDGYP